ncbi:Hypothetical predicted protein [Lecanosticta acicola]|uniref:Uncharacterized protein n=1 Tax=Lecanosticta acicola TaxID=111012 RepID=A0AAI8Z1R5_9PEZI|nr:Hypothetical predicted protein [Lecanosticta acicola]
MLSKRTFAALGSAEGQLLRTQWLRSGQCARCFHASQQQNAEDNSGAGNDKGTPYNAPKRGPTRQQRSAKISNEISMLQRGPPPSASVSGPDELQGPGSATGTYHAPPQAPTTSAGFMETPQDIVGETGRMGENVSAGREGPNAQGVGRPVRYEDRRGDAPQDTTQLARGARAGSGVEEPSEGGASVLGGGAELNPGHHQEWIARSGRQGSAKQEDSPSPKWNKAEATGLLRKLERERSLGGVAYKPNQGHRRGSLTIAEGTERDRLVDRMRNWIPRWRKTTPPNVIARLVVGRYTGTRRSKDQPVLTKLSSQLKMNSTYLGVDTARFAKKVRELLPLDMVKKKKTQQRQAKQ